MPRAKSYLINLTDFELIRLKRLSRQECSENKKKRIAILLWAHKVKNKESYEYIALRLNVSIPTVIETCKSYCHGGLAAALCPKRAGASNISRLKVNGRIEAYLLAIACFPPPCGKKRWSLALLRTELSKVLGITLSTSTIRRVLSANALRPHLSAYWQLQASEYESFMDRMPQLLSLYEQPYNEHYPLWCMDERPYNLPHSTATIFCFFQPHTGRIITFIARSLTSKDWAVQVKSFLAHLDVQVQQVSLVMDNLNIHSLSSLFRTFSEQEAHQIASRLNIYYTSKHGSWLNMAEIALKMLAKYCLISKCSSLEELTDKSTAWTRWYNAHITQVIWQYAPKAQGSTLCSLYPQISFTANEAI